MNLFCSLFLFWGLFLFLREQHLSSSEGKYWVTFMIISYYLNFTKMMVEAKLNVIYFSPVLVTTYKLKHAETLLYLK